MSALEEVDERRSQLANATPKRASLPVGPLMLALLLHGTVWIAALGPLSLDSPWPPATWLRRSVFFHHPAIAPNPGLYDAGVLLWGAERRQAGQDPLAPELLGNDGVYYNYPSGWRVLSWLGLRASDRVGLGWFFAVVFSATLCWLLPPTRIGALPWHALILLSPASLNALAEGNGELLVLGLVGLAVQFARRTGAGAEALSVFSLGCAALLKLYPAAGFAALALPRGRRRWLAVGAGVLAGAFMVGHAAEIRAVVDRTPRAPVNGFGCAMLPARAVLVAQVRQPWLDKNPSVAAVVNVLAKAEPVLRGLFIGVVIAGITYGWRRARSPRAATAVGDPAAAMGLILFIGAFGIGNSWCHRLLVPVVCLAAFYYRERRWGMLTWVMATLWSAAFTSIGHEGWFAVEQVMFWTLLGVLSVGWGRICSSAFHRRLAG